MRPILDRQVCLKMTKVLKETWNTPFHPSLTKVLSQQQKLIHKLGGKALHRYMLNTQDEALERFIES